MLPRTCAEKKRRWLSGLAGHVQEETIEPLPEDKQDGGQRVADE